MYLRYAACGDPRSAGVSAVYLEPGAGGVHLAAQLADVALPGRLQLTEELGHRLINMQLAETSKIYLVIVNIYTNTVGNFDIVLNKRLSERIFTILGTTS